MDSASTIVSFLVAALLGFLIGLERERKREWHGSIFAGIRTFPLIALFGAVCGQLSLGLHVLFSLVGLLTIGALLTLAYWRASAGAKVGGTTEVAALVTYGLGVLAGLGSFVVALAGAVIVTGVLSSRDELRKLSNAVTQEDLYAVVQLAAVSLIILPLVPDERFGPWGVWNPRTIWILVVLISGISFVGYLASKLIGTQRGIGLSGLVGGLASSTAVTLSFSARSRLSHSLSLILAVGVLAASVVTVPRLLILLSIVQPRLIMPLLVPFGVLFTVTLLGTVLTYRISQQQAVEEVQLNNPFRLRTALIFAFVFALVLLITRAAQEYLGEEGIYLASILAGMTQLDAITLTLAREVEEGLRLEVATRGLAIAAATNNLFKVGLALMLGTRPFAWAVLLTLVSAAVACILAAWFIPLPL